MTPVRRQLPRFRRPTDRLSGAVLGVLLLVLLFVPARDPVTHGLTIEWRPSAELAFLLFLVAVAGAARPQVVAARPAAGILAVLVAAMALLNLVDATTPTLLGRDLNLYWDLPHLPTLFGFVGEAAGFWRVAVAIAVLTGAIFLLIEGITWIWREVLSVLTNRRVALGFAILLGVAMDVTALMPAEERPLATGLGLDIIRQSVAVVQDGLPQQEAAGRMPRPSRRRCHRTATLPGLNSATSISSTSNPTAPRSSTRRSSVPGSANR